jgi:spermidine synthase
VVLALVPWLSHQRIHSSPSILEETETAYQYVQVVEDGPERSMRFDEGRTIQSEERSDGRLTNGYWDLVEAMPELAGVAHPRVLILGMAAGSVARGIVENRAPGSISVVGVEIDPKVIELGRKYFALGHLGANVEVHAEDARAFLEHSADRFDMVVLDVYANQRYIPPHLVTQEFFHRVKQRLTPGGFLVANVNSPTASSRLLQSFVRTIRSEFSVVESVAVPRRWNWELVASSAPLPWETAVGRVPEIFRPVLEYARTRRQSLDDHLGMVLTDDRAPVELLTDSAVYESSVARR